MEKMQEAVNQLAFILHFPTEDDEPKTNIEDNSLKEVKKLELNDKRTQNRKEVRC